MKQLSSFTITFLAVILLQGCSDKLTREKAQQLLIEKEKLSVPQIRIIQKKFFIRCWCVGSSVCIGGNKWEYQQERPMLERLRKDGLIVIEKDFRSSNQCQYDYAIVKLTDQAKQYLVSEDENNFKVKTCEDVFGEITGIQEREGTGEAVVEYTSRLGNLTPFGEVYKTKTGEEKRQKKLFRKFDDGWRFE